MRRLPSLGGLALLTIGAALLGGCPQNGTNDTGELSNTELSAGEKDALVAGSQGCQSLGQASAVAKSTAQDDDDESAFEIPQIPTGTTQYSFGNCPEVTMTLENAGTLTFSLDLDFGDGCTPYYTEEDYYCTGSASGTFSQTDKTIDMTFEAVSCGYASLDGDISVAYDIDGRTITLAGDWDLDYEDDIGPIQTDGEGTSSYDAENYITTFTIFNGTITDTVTSWTMGLNAIKMSYPTYGAYLPYAGEATFSGTEIRTVKVKFDEDSPSTGIVQVSVAGGPYFEVDLFALSGVE